MKKVIKYIENISDNLSFRFEVIVTDNDQIEFYENMINDNPKYSNLTIENIDEEIICE